MDPARYRIVLIVLAGHLTLIGVMVVSGVGSFTPPAPQPIQVQLLSPSPQSKPSPRSGPSLASTPGSIGVASAPATVPPPQQATSQPQPPIPPVPSAAPPSPTRAPAVPRAATPALETSTAPSLSVPNDSAAMRPAPGAVAPTASRPPATAPPPGGSADDRVERGPTVDASFAGNRLPEYPAMSRRLGEQGVVVLRVFITPDGRASDVTLVKSSGSARLDRSAIDAIREWRFVPARQAGRPVGAWYEWRWEFRLNG
jgi:periplasmic protein TonB